MLEIENINVVPHSLESERAVLGAILLDGASWNKVDGYLQADHFLDCKHQLIFDAMVHQNVFGVYLDIISVSELLKNIRQLENAGGLSYLTKLVRETPGSSNIRAYAEIVYERACLRKLIKMKKEISKSVHECNIDSFDPSSILDTVEKEVKAILYKEEPLSALEYRTEQVVHHLGQLGSWLEKVKEKLKEQK